MKHTSSHYTPSSRRGVVLLIAVLVGGVALAVGLGIYQRTYKELYFASFWKQTQVAFVAADAGLECALFWDLHNPLPGNSASCFDTSFAWTPNPPGGGPWLIPQMTVFGGCVNITVTKVGLKTHIDTRGNNTCDVTNPRRIERGLSIDY